MVYEIINYYTVKKDFDTGVTISAASRCVNKKRGKKPLFLVYKPFPFQTNRIEVHKITNLKF